MYRILLSFTAAALIAGCSSAPPQQENDSLDHLGTIAIISLIGNEISLQHVGSSDNPRARSIVTSWRQDDFAARAANSYLTSKGHKVAPLRYKTAPLLKTYTNSQSNTNPHIKNIRPELQALLNTYPANTFILIYRNENPDFIGDADEKLFSQGLYHRTKIFGSDTTATYSSIRIDLVRTVDFSVPASVANHSHTIIDNGFWHNAYKNSSDRPTLLKSNNRRKIMSSIQNDLRNSINASLEGLGL